MQGTYLGLTLLTTLSASLIWGINTLFLLDAGLSNLEAFAANAFFTAGMMLFEIPTGVVADLRGRRLSFVLGALTLAATTACTSGLWWWEAPFWAWALVSVGLGLGFTFFSGAVEAWLVDALTATGYAGDLTTVFGRGQAVTGAAMLGGSVLGGVIAQATQPRRAVRRARRAAAGHRRGRGCRHARPRVHTRPQRPDAARRCGRCSTPRSSTVCATARCAG